MSFVIKDGILKKYIPEQDETNVVVPEEVTQIGSLAFRECKSITSVTIPKSVTKIGSGAFIYCTSLTTINIPEKVTKIGMEAFSNCTSLKSITIPKGVKEIPIHAFYNCPKLVSVTIPEGVKKIGDCAFFECSSLKSIVIPESVTQIDRSVFQWCSSLTSINIPEGVQQIDNRLFLGCRFLKTMTIFGCTVQYKKCNWAKVTISEIKDMLDKKDYNVKMDAPTKYMFVTQVFIKKNQPEAEEYIKKNITRIVKFFIDENDYLTVKALFECDKFITKKNIMPLVGYAIDNTQKGGDMQIQIITTNYRANKFPDLDTLPKS